jgi:beta-lactamase class D
VALGVAFGMAACVSAAERRVEERPELGRFFEEHAAQGTFVLLVDADGRRVVYNPDRAATGFLPASTFKILNSLASLEAGVVGVDDTIAWDGVERAVAAWNQDQRMREAFQRSTVWFYQELARRLGEARMRAALVEAGYGKQDMGGGIDQFWLTGDLRISALEQVEFLRRLRHRELGFPERVVAQVEQLMILEQCPNYTLHGKTGWARPDGIHLGWLVGWVDSAAGVHYYALNLESHAPDFPMMEARPSIVRGILQELGALPPTCSDEPSIQAQADLGPDRGVGVLAFASTAAPGTTLEPPFADTMVVRERPEAGSTVLARFIFRVPEPFAWSYVLEPVEAGVRSNALEFEYEVDGLPIDSLGHGVVEGGSGWVRVVHGVASDGTPRTGWVRHDPDRTEIHLWASELPLRPLFFVGADAIAFHDAPGGTAVALDLARRGELGPPDYRLEPMAVEGRWMRARVVSPDASCDGEESGALERVVWIEYLDARGRPRVWYYTRGC